MDGFISAHELRANLKKLFLDDDSDIMISALAWVPKGMAKQQPVKYDLNDTEYERICEMTKQHLSLAQDDLDEAKSSSTPEIDEPSAEVKVEKVVDAADELAEYEMENYDEEAEEEPEYFSTGAEQLAVFRDNNEDPYITLKDDEDDDEDEKEDLIIKPTDSIVLVGKTEEDLSYLEVHVYDTMTDSLYVHHDIMLPSFPLCIESINTALKAGDDCRNWCAIGSFEPTIELWNLDIVDAMYPHAILGPRPSAEPEKSSGKKKEKKEKTKSKKPARDAIGHSDAVMSLSWNQQAHNFLLSSSADKTIILWDVVEQKQIRKFIHHSDKVSCVMWHPQEASKFISAGYDRRIHLCDARLEQPVLLSIDMDSDIESMTWDMHSLTEGEVNSGKIVVGLDSGVVLYLQLTPNGFEKVVSISAYSTALTHAEMHPHIPGMLITTAAEASNQVKIWDISQSSMEGDDKMTVTLLKSRDVEAGKIYSGQICPDDVYLTSFGGSAGSLSVWNVTDSKTICKRFHGRVGRSGVVDMYSATSIQSPTNRELIQKMSEMKEEVIDEEEDAVDDDSEEVSDDDEAEMEETLEEMRGVRQQ